jgi:hypothetical protein
MIDESETMGYDAEPIAENESESEFHKAAREVMDLFLDRSLRLAWQYNGNRMLAFAAMTHALGKSELTGWRTATDMAVGLFGNKKKKAAVTKAIKYFQDNLHLPPALGQRSEASRKSMAVARKKQLKEKR